mmetsp:Transcript_7233/g.22201  ORF Transcript_7233/g.22201 Transcript_7233/m.22201 type:complete len:333 (+) Transcript_7233:2277-3275(+)
MSLILVLILGFNLVFILVLVCVLVLVLVYIPILILIIILVVVVVVVLQVEDQWLHLLLLVVVVRLAFVQHIRVTHRGARLQFLLGSVDAFLALALHCAVGCVQHLHAGVGIATRTHLTYRSHGGLGRARGQEADRRSIQGLVTAGSFAAWGGHFAQLVRVGVDQTLAGLHGTLRVRRDGLVKDRIGYLHRRVTPLQRGRLRLLELLLLAGNRVLLDQLETGPRAVQQHSILDERGAHQLDGRGSMQLLLAQTSIHKAQELHRPLARILGATRWRILRNNVHHTQWRKTVVRWIAIGQLDHRDAERPDVGLFSVWLAFDHLWGHEQWSAHDRP